MSLWVRIAAQLAVATINVAAKAFARAYAEVAANPQAAKKAAENVAASGVLGRRMAAQEARLVLNLEEAYSREDVEKRFERLFVQNDVEKGGSFYLQSKIYRARESLLEELGEDYQEPDILVEKRQIESNDQNKEEDNNGDNNDKDDKKSP
eukprot:TRINITY_DN3942_c0_g1_i2.p1 TRINITY_DN3942_c0_g1~~TRINITY_DN3942_c0_g1_i2.p1  ORF type:complete len:151 (-),score=39.76 TRINITY_DN3942_c0_g1_i2:6-458(-)